MLCVSSALENLQILECWLRLSCLAKLGWVAGPCHQSPGVFLYSFVPRTCHFPNLAKPPRSQGEYVLASQLDSLTFWFAATIMEIFVMPMTSDSSKGHAQLMNCGQQSFGPTVRFQILVKNINHPQWRWLSPAMSNHGLLLFLELKVCFWCRILNNSNTSVGDGVAYCQWISQCISIFPLGGEKENHDFAVGSTFRSTLGMV